MKRGFTFKISLLLAVPVLLTSIFLNIIFRESYIADKKDYVEERVTALARLKSSYIEDHLIAKDYRVLSERLKEDILSIKHINDIYVYNSQGALVADANVLSPAHPNTPWIRSALSARSPRSGWNGYSLMHMAPVYHAGRLIGFLYMEYNADYLTSSIQKKRDLIVSLIVFLTLAAIVIGISFARKLITPLVAIAEASKKVADGDLSVSVAISSQDELGLLAGNFNTMVEKMNATSGEMTNYTRNLEYVIDLRTERLNNVLKELQHQKDFMDQLISSVGALIMVTDTGGRVVLFNRKCEEVTGFMESEVMGKYIWDFLIPEVFTHAAKTVLEELREKGGSKSLENPCLTKNGNERTILWNNTVIAGDTDETRYIIGTGIDVTEKRLIEGYVIESQRIQSIATLVSGLSHNLNNLLTGVLGYAGLLRIKLSSLNTHGIEEASGYVDIVENSARKASELIRQLMTFTKKTPYETRAINPNTVVSDTLKIIAVSFPKTISIETALGEDVRDINADSEKIQQVVLSICLNAKDAMPKGGVMKIETYNIEVIKAELPMQQPGKYAAIRISDTGAGMSEEVKARIYEPFFTTKDLLHHTGLGLSTARSIISSHNGYITVTSGEGAGSTFTVHLPAA